MTRLLVIALVLCSFLSGTLVRADGTVYSTFSSADLEAQKRDWLINQKYVVLKAERSLMSARVLPGGALMLKDTENDVKFSMVAGALGFAMLPAQEKGLEFLLHFSKYAKNPALRKVLASTTLKSLGKAGLIGAGSAVVISVLISELLSDQTGGLIVSAKEKEAFVHSLEALKTQIAELEAELAANQPSQSAEPIAKLPVLDEKSRAHFEAELKKLDEQITEKRFFIHYIDTKLTQATPLAGGLYKANFAEVFIGLNTVMSGAVFGRAGYLAVKAATQRKLPGLGAFFASTAAFAVLSAYLFDALSCGMKGDDQIECGDGGLILTEGEREELKSKIDQAKVEIAASEERMRVYRAALNQK